MNLSRIAKEIKRLYPSVTVSQQDGCVRLSGQLDKWEDVILCGKIATKAHSLGVLNDITLSGFVQPPMKQSPVVDDKYDGRRLDVLVVGGGVVGCAVLRELSRYDLKIALAEKECDVATAQSGRNDGIVHVGIDLHGNTNKISYLMRSNPQYEQLSSQLDFKFERNGQYLMFDKWFYLFGVPYLRHRVKKNGIPSMVFCKGKDLKAKYPHISRKTKFGLFFPSGGTVCPYGMTIALAENAVTNGAEVWLNTAVTGMEVTDGEIQSVHTNRGTVYPKVVVNCAGVYSDVIAQMANDRFFTIHPRRGTDCILDKNSVDHLDFISTSMYGNQSANKTAHTKGGGIMPTVDKNMLVGPDAVETPYREDMATTPESLDYILNRQKNGVAPNLNRNDVITYFTGVRAATYEENFVVCKGKKTKNIVHAAGIQSPGLSASPAISQDVSKWTVELLQQLQGSVVKPNPNFNPIRKGVKRLNEMTDVERDALIKTNPDYGVIVCRCEGISKGEIIDAIHSPIPVYTVDGLKRRVRTGMGRCQGGFCQPLVLDLISKEYGIPYEQICKRGDANILYGNTKQSLSKEEPEA